jgi:hypothetical protein
MATVPHCSADLDDLLHPGPDPSGSGTGRFLAALGVTRKQSRRMPPLNFFSDGH